MLEHFRGNPLVMIRRLFGRSLLTGSNWINSGAQEGGRRGLLGGVKVPVKWWLTRRGRWGKIDKEGKDQWTSVSCKEEGGNWRDEDGGGGEGRPFFGILTVLDFSNMPLFDLQGFFWIFNLNAAQGNLHMYGTQTCKNKTNKQKKQDNNLLTEHNHISRRYWDNGIIMGEQLPVCCHGQNWQLSILMKDKYTHFNIRISRQI